MNKLIGIIFGDVIKEEDYSFPKGTPNYIKSGYVARKLLFGDKHCIIVSPSDKGWNLATLKKQLQTIGNICGENVIVELDRLTALQRTNLIQSGVAFVSGTGQMFVPFLGCYFEEKIANLPEPVSQMTANAQLVFLYLYYGSLEGISEANQTQIARALKMSKSTCTRAIRVLCSLDLIKVESEGTANNISLNDSDGKVIDRALKHMISPVHKLMYVDKKPNALKGKISGIRALADGSMLNSLPSDPGFAVSRESVDSIGMENITDYQVFRDFGGEIIEVWKYDPSLLSKTDYVDDISLFLELKDDKDERVQKEVDAIRAKYGLKEV
ncbi:MAG: MarR family transcriptional regulator [Clostridiales bacterium]|nr:MarR family transcriptional regulator [Clostridiales bacterium]